MFWHKTTNCFDIKKLLPDYLENNLPSKVTVKIKQHVETCEFCQKELSALTKTTELLANLPQIQSEQDLWNNIYNRITDTQKDNIKWTLLLFLQKYNKPVIAFASILFISLISLFYVINPFNTPDTANQMATQEEEDINTYVEQHTLLN